MPDELRPDDMSGLWREEPGEPVRMSVEAVRQRAQQLEARTRRAYRNAGVLMVCSAAGYVWFFYLFPGILQRIGAGLTLAAYLYCLYHVRKKAATRLVTGAPAVTCATYKAELRRLREFPLLSNLTVPFIPGPAVFMMGFLVPEFGLPQAAGVTIAIIALPFLLTIPLLRRRRQMLDREIRSLDALMS